VNAWDTLWTGIATALIAAFLIWVVKGLTLRTVRNKSVMPGSPSSARHWRAQLAEALQQHKEAPESERAQFAERVATARGMVEAHEAVRRVGGTTRLYWVSMGTAAGLALFYGTTALIQRSLAFAVGCGIMLLLMVAFEVLGLVALGGNSSRLNALVRAGELGHSNLVRTDPWVLILEYERWVSDPARARELRDQAVADKRDKPARWVRFERFVVGGARRRPGVDTDIWADLRSDGAVTCAFEAQEFSSDRLSAVADTGI